MFSWFIAFLFFYMNETLCENNHKPDDKYMRQENSFPLCWQAAVFRRKSWFY